MTLLENNFLPISSLKFRSWIKWWKTLPALPIYHDKTSLNENADDEKEIDHLLINPLKTFSDVKLFQMQHHIINLYGKRANKRHFHFICTDKNHLSQLSSSVVTETIKHPWSLLRCSHITTASFGAQPCKVPQATLKHSHKLEHWNPDTWAHRQELQLLKVTISFCFGSSELKYLISCN